MNREDPVSLDKDTDMSARPDEAHGLTPDVVADRRRVGNDVYNLDNRSVCEIKQIVPDVRGSGGLGYKALPSLDVQACTPSRQAREYALNVRQRTDRAQTHR